MLYIYIYIYDCMQWIVIANNHRPRDVIFVVKWFTGTKHKLYRFVIVILNYSYADYSVPNANQRSCTLLRMICFHEKSMLSLWQADNNILHPTIEDMYVK